MCNTACDPSVKYCNHCEQGCDTTYSSCTSCSENGYGISFKFGFVYCLEYCPKGYSSSSPNSCTPTTNIVFELILKDFADAWNSRGIQWAVFGQSPGYYPAFLRGYHFDGSGGAIKSTTFQSNIMQTTTGWVKADQIST